MARRTRVIRPNDNLSSSRTVKFVGRHKSGKSNLALSAPKPAMINFDRSEDFLLEKTGNGDILRDRIIVPPALGVRQVTPLQASVALTRFEQDVTQAKALSTGGAVQTLIIDGGSLLVDLITIKTLDEASNPNKTFRYADRNTYIKNLFNELNESGMNVIWTSKAKPVWVGSERVPNLYQPDCHEDIPYMVDVNVQMVTEKSPDGVNFYGVIGTNAYKPVLVDKRIRDLTWDMLWALLLGTPQGAAGGNARIHGPYASDSNHVPIANETTTVSYPPHTVSVPIHQHLATDGDFGEVQR